MATLYLIPSPLGENAPDTLPLYAADIVRGLDVFITEKARTSRQFLKELKTRTPLQELTVFELDKHKPEAGLEEMLAPLKAGKDIGLLSEAGCPGVADPGSAVVTAALRMGARVSPLPGASSLLLALMASGLNGQKFAFHGYLPVDRNARRGILQNLEKETLRSGQTQIFIETPYRNKEVFNDLLKHLAPVVKLCVATDITLRSETIRTKTIAEWKNSPAPDVDKRPTVFLIG